MYKEGAKVQFIEHENLGKLSGKVGIIIKQVNDEEVIIEDDIYNSQHVYEVYVPLQPTILVMDGYIKPC